MAFKTGNTQVDNLLTRLEQLFPDDYKEISEQRANDFARELEGGEGRTYEELVTDIFDYVVEGDDVEGFITKAFGDRGLNIAANGETEQQRVDRIEEELTTGKRSFFEFLQTLDSFAAPASPESTERRGGQQIPAGTQLIRDSDDIYYLVGDVYGAKLGYEIGTIDDLNEIYGGISVFDGYRSVSNLEAEDILRVGTVDEINGTTESLQAQFDRDMRSAGLENPPEWLVRDKRAFATYVAGVNEGWSAERTWNALQGTQGFKDRFSGLDTILNQLGTTSLTEAIGEYTRREAAIRASLLESRGPQTNTSNEYVSSLIGAGWDPEEVNELLQLEEDVRANPEALANINEILRYQGQPELNPDDFVTILQEQNQSTLNPDFTPSALFESVNDALRFQALLTEGIDIDLGFATDLGDGTSDAIVSRETFSKQAQLAASYVAANQNAIDLSVYGLDRDDIVAAVFNEESPTGRSVSEVNQVLERLGRERAKAAEGYAASQSYIDAGSRLRVQGLGDFG